MGERTAAIGGLCAVMAFSLWGIAPMYFKLLSAMPAIEILMHRILWSMVILVVLILATRQLAKVRNAMGNTQVLKVLLLSGLLLAGNWFLFIWAVNNEHILDASLGYYINPLLNVLLGYLFLKERLHRAQQLAVALAAIGVAVLIISHGTVPWIALVLAGSFGIYGLLRKQVAVDSLPGLLIETTLMLPFALIYWVEYASGASDMLANDWHMNGILFAAGVVTTAPLLFFTAAARRLRLATLGFFQYIGPSIMFVLAVFLYEEPLEPARMATFACVWSALLIYSYASFSQYRRQRAASVRP